MGTQNKVSLYLGSNAWMAGMEKSQSIQMINAGFVIAASRLNLTFLLRLKGKVHQGYVLKF